MKHQIAIGVFVAALVAAIVAPAVWSAKPSESVIAQEITRQAAAELGEGVIRVENFKKLNGYAQGDNGYVAEAEFDLVFLKSSDEIIRQAAARSGQRLGGLGAGLQSMALSFALGKFEAGHRVHREQAINLVRTERGWRIKKP